MSVLRGSTVLHLNVFYLVSINLSIFEYNLSINFLLFQWIVGWALIRGLGAYLKVRLLDIPVSRVGAYWRGRLLVALNVICCIISPEYLSFFIIAFVQEE